MQRALIFGNGRSGKAAQGLLCRLGIEAQVLDGNDTFPDGDYEMAIVSPGVPLTHTWIQLAKARGISLKSELQLGCEELKRKGWKLLAVTGSKGKSSVVKAVAEAIRCSGKVAIECGNYGTPVCDVALRDSVGIAVVEVSSFMMETTELPADTFEAAAILNLQADHLDRHGTLSVYHKLKRKLLTMAKAAITESSIATLEVEAQQLVGTYFDNSILRTNGLMAIALMKVAGVGDLYISQAMSAFQPLPHRMNRVAEYNGVLYIDDSKATSLAALAAGVAMTSEIGRKIVLIAGGLAKGDNPKSVLNILTEWVKKVYLIGSSAEVFYADWKNSVDCEICGDLERAVASAKHEAVNGDAVLLSPGAASFDQFKNFGERGDAFVNFVKQIRNEK